MATKREMHITISKSGEVSINVKCVQGQSCIDASKRIEEALGGAVIDRELTADYYAANPQEGHCAVDEKK